MFKFHAIIKFDAAKIRITSEFYNFWSVFVTYSRPVHVTDGQKNLYKDLEFVRVKGNNRFT